MSKQIIKFVGDADRMGAESDAQFAGAIRGAEYMETEVALYGETFRGVCVVTKMNGGTAVESHLQVPGAADLFLLHAGESVADGAARWHSQYAEFHGCEVCCEVAHLAA